MRDRSFRFKICKVTASYKLEGATSRGGSAARFKRATCFSGIRVV